METVREFPYLGDRVSVGGGYDAVVIARARCGWVRFWVWGELHGRRFPLRLKGAAYNSYVWLVMLYESELWCLNDSEMGISRTTM